MTPIGAGDGTAEDPSFLPTIEAYTSTAHGGNSATLLLNGDQIFPAQLAAIRSARVTIGYAQSRSLAIAARELAEAAHVIDCVTRDQPTPRVLLVRNDAGGR